MVHNLLDLTLLGQMPDDDSSKTAVDLESFDEDGLGDESESGDFFQDTVVRGFVEDDGVLCFVFDFSFGPLFLLGGLAASGRRGFCGGLGLCQPKWRVSGSGWFRSERQ